MTVCPASSDCTMKDKVHLVVFSCGKNCVNQWICPWLVSRRCEQGCKDPFGHHHHHWFSAVRQVPGTHLLHSSLPSALLFIFAKELSIRSSVIPILGLPFGLFPNILSSSTSLSSPFPLNTCPIQFFFLSRIIFTRHLFCPTIDNTSSFFILSCQHTLSSLLQIHISRASNLSISALRSVHVSHPYNTTSTFTSLVFNAHVNSFVRSSFLLLNASFASAILVFTS